MPDKNYSEIAINKAVLAKMRHDMRTPLGALIGLAAILEQMEPLTPKQEEIISTMQSSADDLKNIIDCFFDGLEEA